MQRLKEYLNTVTPGPISDDDSVVCLLEECWDQLEGGDAEGMKSDKLYRIEEVSWEPPWLSFIIERHGGIVQGSTRAELHRWTVDVEAKSARCMPESYRQLKPNAKKWDHVAAAQDIVRLIDEHQTDTRLKWKDDGSVRVMIGEILPEGNGPKQTLAGRRKRFRALLDQKLEEQGWRKVRQYVYAPPAT